jgi:uncharacterized membrane protein YheB (UPF0754 family)
MNEDRLGLVESDSPDAVESAGDTMSVSETELRENLFDIDHDSREHNNDSPLPVEDEIDQEFNRELDRQMEAMFDEYSDTVHAEIQKELDRQLDEQLEAQLQETYSQIGQELEDDLERQMQDAFDRQLRLFDPEEAEPRLDQPLPTDQKPQVADSSVTSINATIQRVVDKHRSKDKS